MQMAAVMGQGQTHLREDCNVLAIEVNRSSSANIQVDICCSHGAQAMLDGRPSVSEGLMLW